MVDLISLFHNFDELYEGYWNPRTTCSKRLGSLPTCCTTAHRKPRPNHWQEHVINILKETTSHSDRSLAGKQSYVLGIHGQRRDSANGRSRYNVARRRTPAVDSHRPECRQFSDNGLTTRWFVTTLTCLRDSLGDYNRHHIHDAYSWGSRDLIQLNGDPGLLCRLMPVWLMCDQYDCRSPR